MEHFSHTFFIFISGVTLTVLFRSIYTDLRGGKFFEGREGNFLDGVIFALGAVLWAYLYYKILFSTWGKVI